MRLFFAAAAIVSIACANVWAQAYRWVDKDGRVHYTQTPPPPEAKNVRKKKLNGNAGESSNLPYATQQAAQNFPVTLYTSPDCGATCDEARASLVRRGVPFKEISIGDPASVEDLKKLSGKAQVPLLVVGRDMQTGFEESLYKNLLDLAGYPASGPRLPLEALRKTEPAAKAPEPAPAPVQASEGSAGGPSAEPEAAAK